jgi:hypothetical protein
MVGHVMSGVDGERGLESEVMRVVRKLNGCVFLLSNPWPTTTIFGLSSTTVAACIAERMKNVWYVTA